MPDSSCGPVLPRVRPPFPVRAPYSTAPAPRPLQGTPHVVLDAALPAALARRRERLADDRAGVLVACTDDPEGLAAAVRHALALVPGGVDVADGAAWEELAEAFLLACADDLVVLRRTGPGELVAELLAVAFPRGWPPRHRAGATLAQLHAPVADGERLRRAAPALSEALLTKGPYLQHVWGLDPSGRLDRDPSAPDAEPPSCPPPAQWWLRVEQQTTLPLGDRALFLIRPYLTPLPDLDPQQRRVLADAVASMSAQALTYKGLVDVRDDLLAWLRASTAAAAPPASPAASDPPEPARVLGP